MIVDSENWKIGISLGWWRHLCWVLVAASVISCSGESTDKAPDPSISDAVLKERLEALQQSRPEIPGFAVAVVTFDGAAASAATGKADPDGRPMTADTPARIASITKTFAAATALRLWEQGLIDLDAPISALISSAHNALLTGDGYDTDAITLRQLLMHASGMDDHFASDAFRDMALADPQRVWTRTDQLEVLVETSDPLGRPGERFSYSDSGYLLIGEIIERTTGKTLSASIWELLKLNDIGLKNSWWDEERPSSASGPDRAHQWLSGLDSYPIHGSVDAFGGGGIVASVEDVARFFAALFNGKIFDDPATLQLMVEAPGHPSGSPYRIGLFAGEIDGNPSYGHGGFWGTDALVVPSLGIAVTSVSLDQSGMPNIQELDSNIARLKQ